MAELRKRMVANAYQADTPEMPIFRLDLEANKTPTEFEIHFIAGPEQHRYEYRIAFQGGRILEETLHVHRIGGRGQLWFHRTADTSKAHDKVEFPSPALRGEKKRLEVRTGPTIPFLKVASEANNEQLMVAAHWLLQNHEDYFAHNEGLTSQRCLTNPSFKIWVVELMRNADLGICGLDVREKDKSPRIALLQKMGDNPIISSLLRQEKYEPAFQHSTKEGTAISFPFSDESEGTRHLFELLAPIYQAVVTGRLVLFDELATNLHPLLSRQLIELFHNPEINPFGAQLVFTTHDVSLLQSGHFRRDQVWFTQKDGEGATHLYSLHKFTPRPDEARMKGYLVGKYGAIPHLGPFDWKPTDAESRLKEYLPTDAKGGLQFSNFAEHIQIAIRHADSLFKERCAVHDDDPCLCNPCTQVHLLLGSILSKG